MSTIADIFTEFGQAIVYICQCGCVIQPLKKYILAQISLQWTQEERDQLYYNYV